jgi:hypothetical protein
MSRFLHGESVPLDGRGRLKIEKPRFVVAASDIHIRQHFYTLGVCRMQPKVLQLAQKIADDLRSENRLAAIDALDVAKILLRANTSYEASQHESTQASELSHVEA